MSSSSIPSQLLNFRKMKHDFAQNVLRDGKELFDKSSVKEAKIAEFEDRSIRIEAEVVGSFAKPYVCALEIDRLESEIRESSCNCPHGYDCLHLACLVFHLEEHFENLVVNHFGTKKKKDDKADAHSAQIKEVIKHAENKVSIRKEKEYEKQLVSEYITAMNVLGKSAFFVPEENMIKEQGEMSLQLTPLQHVGFKFIELQILLKLPYRAKPVLIQNTKQFFSALADLEPIQFGNMKTVFGFDSFGIAWEHLLKILRQHLQFPDIKIEKTPKPALLDREGLGEVLACAYDFLQKNDYFKKHAKTDPQLFYLPGLFWENQESPLLFSEEKADLCFDIQYIQEPHEHVFLNPKLILGDKNPCNIDDVSLLECSKPGLIAKGLYYRFGQGLKRSHLLEIGMLKDIAIPSPLFGTFIENAMSELERYAQVHNQQVIKQITTIPQPGQIQAECQLHYANSVLEASINFVYGEFKVPESCQLLSIEHIKSFCSPEGICARNLVDENILIAELFQGFAKDEKNGHYVTNSEKKIVEFMTQILPKNSDKVQFFCPETLQSKFSYDDTKFTLHLKQGKEFDRMEAEFTVEGLLSGAQVNMLWRALSAKRTYLGFTQKTQGNAFEEPDEDGKTKSSKILILQLENIAKVLQLSDELDINKLETGVLQLPLWMLVNLNCDRFQGFPIQITMTDELSELQRQIFDSKSIASSIIPSSIKANLRPYQKTGVDWLSRLRSMGLNGILADDMGLGKTLQAICAITQYFDALKENPKLRLPSQCLIVCPTSLVDNWKEEFLVFQPNLRVTVVNGSPLERKKKLQDAKSWDVLITSYGLVQKDVELYEQQSFGYLILDEAQHIKNRETRNARSVKRISARHKLILTGTPLENSLEDLWSLFDFLMPGLLGTFDCFVNTFLRAQTKDSVAPLETLKKKITPFVLRRMKIDVLDDLPPISHIVYHCHLTPKQQELYQSYAKTACENLMKLVEKEGFEKVRIHVLATLTRLKQICCHPAIFAKDAAEPEDSAKYEMLLDLIGGLIESKHRTVIFSQYTRMLSIIRDDLKKMNAKFCYLDGSSKNRLSIVKQFNENQDIPIFLVSLKAGGSGLNLVGADTVIHYDMWWNPAVENQATDRVWRLGQKLAVSSYKLITLGTIEEKILQMQNVKKELSELVQTDEDMMSKLTWEEVLSLLRT